MTFGKIRVDRNPSAIV